jgi:PKD repeat protein
MHNYLGLDFGDGFTSTLRNPTHVYATAGYYNVTLVVDGGLGSLVRSNYIHVLPHFSVPYTSATTGWTGDMENPSTAWHYGSRSNFGGLNAWQRGSISLTFPPAASGANCWATLLGANVLGGYSQASVWCPSFDMSAAGRYQIRLKTAMEVTTCNSPYGAMVQYSTDNGATWTRLGSKQGVDPNAFASWYNIGGTSGCDWITGTPAGQGWCYTGTTFRQTIYDASTLAGNPKVAFRVAFFPIGLAPYGKGFAFDDFELDFTPIPGIVDTIPGSLAQFDGINDYVETYFGGNLPTFTAEGWVMSPAAPINAARTSLITKANVLEMNWNHPTVGSQGAVALRNTLGTWQDYSFGPLASNSWYHLAVSFDGTSVRTYKNGELVTNAAFAGTLDANTNSWQLGRGTAFFAGQLDEFRIWNGSRTTQQIREAMHRTLDQPELTNVALYYQGNETSGYLKDPATLRNGYLMGGMNRSVSPVAVGKGVSQTLTVAGIGSYNFATCGLVLDYTAFAGGPQDVTVTRIQQFVNEQLPNPLYNDAPNATLVDKNPYFYHAVNAYGVAVFSTNVTANGVPNISPAEALAPANLKLVKRPSNSVALWDLGIPAVSATASSGPTVFDGAATWNGITGFSQLFIGKEIGGPVPVEDLQFQVLADHHSVWLYWEPLGESGDGDWFVERRMNPSVSGTIWRAANPGLSTYHIEDQDIQGSKIWFYRLHQHNANGESRQSEWRMADLGDAAGALRIFPNPSSGSFTVEWINSEPGIALFDLVDAAGRQVWTGQKEIVAGVNRFVVSTEAVASGIYSMRVTRSGRQLISRIVIR